MKLNTLEKYMFTRELETILSSGLSVDEGLSLMEENTLDSNLKEVSRTIKEYYFEYGSFPEAIKKCEAFDSYMEKMIEMGELNGRLDTVMKELSSYYEREEELQNRMKEATAYPFILLCMMTLIVGVLIFKVLPIFENMMKNMGANFNSTSILLMNFAKVFSILSFIVLCISFVLMLIFKLKKSNTDLKNKVFTNFFLTKDLLMKTALAKMTYAFSLFVSSGYPLEETIQYLPDFITHPVLKEKMNKVIQDIESGTDFVDSIMKHKVYPGIYASMLSIGMKTGKQEEVFKKLVDLFEQEVNDSTSKFLNVIEPSIVAILSLIVGIILLSIMLPLMGIMSSLG